jgi:hypothetical protein
VHCGYTIMLFSRLTKSTPIWKGLVRNLDNEAQDTIRNTGKNWKPLDQGAALAFVGAFYSALNGKPLGGFRS